MIATQDEVLHRGLQLKPTKKMAALINDAFELFLWARVESVIAIPRIHHASLGQRSLYIRKVREKEPHLLFWAALRGTAEEDHRRFSLLAQRDEGPKIGVGGYDNTPLELGAFKDLTSSAV